MAQKSRIPAWFELLSSMRFAISLLTMLAIASVIGTVLRQNEPYNSYLNQFGQFWFPVFEALGLYSVYNTGWFLVILAFLVLSTSACIVRQAPQMLREMRTFREHARETSLRQFAHRQTYASPLPRARQQEQVLAWLAAQRYQARTMAREDGVLVAAKRGAAQRLGYIFAHSAIVLVCLGGLLDGNLPLKLQMLLGDKEITQPGQLIADIPARSRLGADNWSFRGNVFVPEGKASSSAVLNVRDGMLLQELPFTVSLKKFHIDHYTTGAPKRFASDIILTDGATGQSRETTIEVNKPVEFAGVTLYQASFDDGGSRLRLAARSLLPGTRETLAVEGEVGESVRLGNPRYDHTLELTGFRSTNVENVGAGRREDSVPGGPGGLGTFMGSAAKGRDDKNLRNVGPSFQYKLRDAAGQAREYSNYMLPVEQEGRWYLFSGMRASPSEPFRYLRLPMDPDGRPDGFFAMREIMTDPARRQALATRFARSALSAETRTAAIESRLTETAARTLELFADRGLESLSRFIDDKLPESERQRAAEAIFRVLQGLSWQAWTMAREGTGQPAPQPDENGTAFVQDAISAISDSFHYGAPLFFQLTGFDEVRASVLQVTRSPGKPIVYLGSALLVLGVFALLYIRERRLFVLIKDDETLLAMASNRKSLDFEEEFRRRADELGAVLGEAAAAR